MFELTNPRGSTHARTGIHLAPRLLNGCSEATQGEINLNKTILRLLTRVLIEFLYNGKNL